MIIFDPDKGELCNYEGCGLLAVGIAAFFECNRAVNQYVNSQADEERRWKRSI